MNTTNDTSYAVQKVRSIREANAVEFDSGACAVKMHRMQDELPRLQEMNQSLANVRRPEKDLAKDVHSFAVPPIDDKHIVKIIEEKDQDRGQ